jgi:hypothetical protein
MYHSTVKTIIFVIRNIIELVGFLIFIILIGGIAHLFFGDVGVFVWSIIGTFLIIRDVVIILRR